MSVKMLIAVVGTTVVLLAGACTGSGGGPEGPSRPERAPAAVAQPPRALPPITCTHTATDPEQASALLAQAAPGQTLCFAGDRFHGADLKATASGTPQQPIVLVGRDTTVGAVSVEADHVIVDGFTTVDGDGLTLDGTGLTARGNEVLRARDDGISCQCTHTDITDNVVRETDGTGIRIEGDRISVLTNDVSRSVMRESNDADGIRFFGTGHRISANKVHDISDDGYPDPPHTDCFQTYDNGSPPTSDVEISANTCHNVDQQCLIATAEESGQDGAVGRSRSLRFVGNTCAVGGAQAVLVRWFPEITVRDNEISGPVLARGVYLADGSTSATVVDNRFRGDYRMVEVDESSRPGLRDEGNHRF
ncbi:right-handed parallel beta-helix repeat-containing protein [Saccharopolyspora tripterygii]